LITIGLFGQTGPDSLCASVNQNGEVLLTWDHDEAVPGTEYDIFRDQGAGFGAAIATTMDLFYNDLDAMANLDDPVRYYVRVRNSTAPVLPEDTVSTIFLELIPTGSSLVAQLEWNFPFDNSSLDGQFTIERGEAGAAFVDLVTLPASTNLYLDTLNSICELTVFTYRVRYERGDCSMFSQEVIGEYEDNVGPPQPEVETITVDPVTGLVTIFWSPVLAPDLAEYSIQRVDLTSTEPYLPIGTVPAETLSFSFMPDDSDPVTWVVRALDDCGNENSFDGEHKTMEVTVFYPECEDFITVDWTPYVGWGDELAGYEVFAILEDDSEILLDATDTTGAYSSLDIPVDPNTEYRVYIKALSSGDQQPSTSNGVLLFTQYDSVIDFHYLSSVSTNLSGQLEVELLQDTTGVGTTYELYRKQGEGDYNYLGLFPAVSGEETITYIDSDVRANELIYTYYWTAFDVCGVELGDSNEGSNILLNTGSSNSNLENRLNWSEYEEWDGDVVEYRIFRGLGEEDPVFYDVVDPFTSEWSEDVEEFLMNEGRFCYRIQAIESANEFGPGATAFSNVSCVTQEPLVWIPSAMVYGGVNDEFKPVLGFVDFETYRMEIYNKWGELLFETSDIEMGWDGTYEGNVVPEDYYRYIITAKDGIGKPIAEEGVFYMVRNAE